MSCRIESQWKHMITPTCFAFYARKSEHSLEGQINTLMRCFWLAGKSTPRPVYYPDNQGRPPTNGNPWLAEISHRRRKSNLPLNHGFTVCWSEEGTSAKWLAISERTWLETTSRVRISCEDGPRKKRNKGKQNKRRGRHGSRHPNPRPGQPSRGRSRLWPLGARPAECASADRLGP